MEETPSVIMMSLTKETGATVFIFCETGFFASIFPRKINSKKAMLQIIASREKKDITFIKKAV